MGSGTVQSDKVQQSPPNNNACYYNIIVHLVIDLWPSSRGGPVGMVILLEAYINANDKARQKNYPPSLCALLLTSLYVSAENINFLCYLAFNKHLVV